MAKRKLKGKSAEERLKAQIITLFERDQLKQADDLFVEYAKLAPTSIERFYLEAMIRVGEGNLNQAEQVLKDGIDLYPGSFDLLLNLGFVYESGQELELAWGMYQEASNEAREEPEKRDVAEALVRLDVGTVSGTSIGP